MTRDVRACEPSATVADAAKVMAQEDVGPVPIVDDGRLVGIVTDRDIVVRVVAEGRDPNATTVKEIASTELVTVSPGDDLDEALNLLAARQVRRLPVVEGERLVGIVAQADIARLGKDKKTGEVVEEISRSPLWRNKESTLSRVVVRRRAPSCGSKKYVSAATAAPNARSRFIVPSLSVFSRVPARRDRLTMGATTCAGRSRFPLVIGRYPSQYRDRWGAGRLACR